MTREELMGINEIGDRIAASVLEYFSNARHLEIISRLKKHGIRFETEQSSTANISAKLAGLSIIISGIFQHHSGG